MPALQYVLIVVSLVSGLGKETFSRQCASIKKNDGCSKVEGAGEYSGIKFTTETCYCNADECNTAMLPRVSLLAIGLGLLLKLIV